MLRSLLLIISQEPRLFSKTSLSLIFSLCGCLVSEYCLGAVSTRLDLSQQASPNKTNIDAANKTNYQTNYQKIDQAIFHFNMGTILEEKKEYKKALAEYETALVLSPQFYKAYINKGSVLESMGRYKEAIVAVKRGLFIHPANHIGWDVLARIYTSMGNFDSVVDASRQCVKVKKFMNCFIRLGYAFEKLKNFKEAHKEFSEGLRYFPKNMELHYGLILQSYKSYDLAAVEKELPLFKKLFPAHPMISAFEQGLIELRRITFESGKEINTAGAWDHPMSTPTNQSPFTIQLDPYNPSAGF